MWSAKEVALHGTLHEMPPSDIAEDWDATLFYCDLVSVERVAYVLSALFTVKRVLLVNFTKQRRHEPFPHFMISSLRRGYPPCHPHIRKATVPADTYLIGQDAGEVGHGSNTSVACSSLHFLLDRSLDRILEGCSKLHYIQAHTQLLGTEPTYTLPTQLSYTEARHYTDTKTKACILPSTRVIRRGHNADALVRMAFWYLLSEYKQCDGTAFIRNDRLARYANHTIRCRGSHLHMNTCMHNYSIAIAMENKSERGYVSEKLFNALLANTVPVYFGAPDIHKYVNPARFLHCHVPAPILSELRRHKRWLVQDSAYSLTPFFGGNLSFIPKHELDAMDIITWAATELKTTLVPCVRAAISVLENRSKSTFILQQPPFLPRQIRRAFASVRKTLLSVVRLATNTGA